MRRPRLTRFLLVMLVLALFLGGCGLPTFSPLIASQPAPTNRPATPNTQPTEVPTPVVLALAD
jgi:hypothetical protein